MVLGLLSIASHTKYLLCKNYYEPVPTENPTKGTIYYGIGTPVNFNLRSGSDHQARQRQNKPSRRTLLLRET
jgi:hypothetical protein